MDKMNLFGDSKPKETTKSKKKIYTEDFKREAVNLASRFGVTKVAEELGISTNAIYSWKKNLEENSLAKQSLPNSLPPAPIQDENGNLTFIIEGKTYSLNVNSEAERERVKDKVNANTLAQYDWFKEEAGEKHWVFYDTAMYISKKDECYNLDLHYNINCMQSPVIPINATSSRSMFSNYDKLPELDLSVFNTVNITNMSFMFEKCRRIITLNLSNFSTSKVTDMSHMFADCAKLTNVNLSSFDTSNVVDMGGMFDHNLNIITLDLSNFNTSKVKWMSHMFQYCKRLKSLDLSNFDTSNLEFMNHMFSGCKMLTTLNLDNFNTSKISNLHSTFMNCRNLTSLDIRGFYTSIIVEPCRPAEEERDPNALYGFFPTIKKVCIQNLFRGCDALKLLKVNEDFQISYQMHLHYGIKIERV